MFNDAAEKLDMNKLHFSNINNYDIKYLSNKVVGLACSIVVATHFNVIYALPQGGVVTDGQATISTPNPNYMQIDQHSNSAVINWQSFNIGAQEHTHFEQPSVNSIAINRVNAANGSSAIFGKLTSTGQIFLLNPAGVIFGPSAQINVGSILASTSDLNFNAYQQGRIELIPNNNYNGQIINQGNISVRDGGYAMFAAPNIDNQGIINAKLGHVQLSSGDFFTVDLYGDGLINLKVPEDQINPILREYKITHSGKIYADGGTITLTAANANKIVSSIINMNGLMQADSIGSSKGKIILTSNDNGYINFNGDSQTYAASGYVKASADNIKLASGSLIDVSSKNNNSNAGEIYIGGNYQGKLLSDSDFNAKNVIVEPNTHLLANAKLNGDGGKIVVWSDDTTSVAGNFEAKGGSESGNGGQIETSGKLVLGIKPEISINTKSNNTSGFNGEWLLDPVTITIDNILANSISIALLNNNVTLTTKDSNTTGNITSEEGDPLNGGTGTPSGSIGDIIFSNGANIGWTTSNKFTAEAARNIVFSGGTINSLGNGDIALVTAATNATPTLPSSCPSGLGCGHILGYLPNSINSPGGGKVEIYVTNPIFGNPTSNLSSLYPNLVAAKSSNFITGPVILYDYIYNTAPGRTVNDIDTTQLATFGPIQQSFALHEDIAFDFLFSGLGSISAPYTSHFDGRGHVISSDGSGIYRYDGNAGFFNVTDSNVIATLPFNDGSQYIKNVNIVSTTTIAHPALPGEAANAGILIGQAIINPSAPLDIFNVNIYEDSFGFASEAIASYDSINFNSIFGNAGALIGKTTGPDGSILNIRDIYVSISGVNSSHATGGIIGDASHNILNLSGYIDVSAGVLAEIYSLIDTDGDGTGETPTNVFAGGIIGKTSNPNFIFNSVDYTDSLGATTNPYISVGFTPNTEIVARNLLSEGAAFAGGLIGGFNGSAVNINPSTQINIYTPNIEALINDSGFSPTNSGLISSAFAGGLFGAMSNPLLSVNINALSTNINSVITASTNVANSHSYVGGLIGDFLGSDINLNTIAPGNIDIASYSLYSNVLPFLYTLSTPDISNFAYTGGLIGNIRSSGPTQNTNAIINSNVNFSTDVFSADVIMSDTQDGIFKSFAGGIFGNAFFNKLDINGTLNINNVPVSAGISAAASTRGSQAYSGGISGFDNNISVSYNNIINTSGASSTINQSVPFNNSEDISAYAGGIAGFNKNITTIFNADVAISNSAGNGLISADASGSGASSFAGGLYGYMSGDPSTNNLTVNNPVIVNVDIKANTDGAALDITNIADKYTTGGIFAGGLFGLNSGINTTINNTVIIQDNSLVLSATSTNSPTGEAEQAVGGIAGGFVNASFSFNTSTFSYINERTSSTSHGGNAGVFGLLDINELSPTLAAGVTSGLLNDDELNDGIDWDSTTNNITSDNLTPNLFTFNATDPCSGPSAGLCVYIAPPPPPPPTEEEIAEETVLHTNVTQSTAHGGGHDGHSELHSNHLPHPPHTHRHHHDHEGAHQYVTEDHEQNEYQNQTIVLGDPIYNFTVDSEWGIILYPFTYRARHGFLFTTQDNFGDFIRENSGDE